MAAAQLLGCCCTRFSTQHNLSSTREAHKLGYCLMKYVPLKLNVCLCVCMYVCNKQNIVTKIVSSWLKLQDLTADCHLKLQPGSGIPGPIDDRWSTAEMVTGRGNSKCLYRAVPLALGLPPARNRVSWLKL
jgi:hypothetical protein